MYRVEFLQKSSFFFKLQQTILVIFVIVQKNYTKIVLEESKRFIEMSQKMQIVVLFVNIRAALHL